MRRAAIPALVLLALLAAAQPAAAGNDRCKLPARAWTVAKSTRILVYQYETRVTGPEGASYACNRRTGRRFLLDRPRDELYLSPGNHQHPDGPAPQLAGYHLAYVTTQFEGAEGEYDRLRTLDLATGKKRALGLWSIDGDEFLHGFALVASGAIGWAEFSYVQGGPGDETGVSRVWRWGAAGKELLDSAPGFDGISDFGVSRTRGAPRFYWMNGATPRGAVLR